MIKNAIGIKDLSNTHLHAKFNEVVNLFREVSLATGLGGDVLLLEEFGTTLVQRDWTDDTGWFVTYRLHPMYSHMTKMLEACLHVQSHFAKICGSSDFKVTRVDETDPNTRITVYVASGRHSIGD